MTREPHHTFLSRYQNDLSVRRTWGFDMENQKFRIGGEGNTPISFTSRLDAARYTVHVLTTLSASELEWRTFRIEGDRAVSTALI